MKRSRCFTLRAPVCSWVNRIARRWWAHGISSVDQFYSRGRPSEKISDAKAFLCWYSCCFWSRRWISRKN